MKKIAIGSDHAGFELKELIKNRFSSIFDIIDCGTYSLDSVDYPDFAHIVASEVEQNNVDFGVLICGSANGSRSTY